MINFRGIQVDDVPAIKALADANRRELGFTPCMKFEEAASQRRGFVAVCDGDVIGFVIFRHRKNDSQTTLSDICVRQDFRHQHIGEKLVAHVIKECTEIPREYIQLKCPVELPANRFYQRLGFTHYMTESGKKRSLNVWRLFVPPKPINEN
jgi:ribosomal protein S18 acetylase RimI-like enzyme